MKKTIGFIEEIILLENLIGKKQSEVQKALGIPKQKDFTKTIAKWFYSFDQKELMIEIKADIVIRCSSLTQLNSSAKVQLKKGILKRYLIKHKYKHSYRSYNYEKFKLQKKYAFIILDRTEQGFILFYKFFINS